MCVFGCLALLDKNNITRFQIFSHWLYVYTKPTCALYNEPTVMLFFFVGGVLVLRLNDLTIVLHCICQGPDHCMRSI